MTCIDIGARGGITRDLLPIAPAVDAVGFEPDAAECQRLNAGAASDPGPWRSLRFIPVALSESGGARTLHLTRRRGTSSMLQAVPAVAEKFMRGEYFVVDEDVKIETVPLNSVVDEHGLGEAVYLTIDVEGMEMEIFRSASRILGGNLLAIRCEVSFLQGRLGQPSFGEIESHLRGFGFVPMGFPEMHHWRRLTRRKHPIPAKGAIPYSKGQLAHCDVLFYRDPDQLADDTPVAVEHLLRAAFLAMLYEHVDHAHAIMMRPPVAAHLSSHYAIIVEQELSKVSRHLASRYRANLWRRRWIAMKGRIGRSLGLLD
jgi:FkbM family methyltransferase